MKKMTKYNLSSAVIFALLILLTIGASGADAAGTTGGVSGTWGNLAWTLDNSGLLTITGSGKMNDFLAEDGMEILDNVAWLCYRDDIKSVVLDSGVTSIGAHAFGSCEALEQVSIPTSITSIGTGGFYFCRGLRTITIPQNVTFIGDQAFYACSNLREIIIPSSVTTINWSAFSECHGLEHATILPGLTSIDTSLFYNCSNLASVNIPASVVSIGGYAFQGCDRLKDVYYGGTQTQWNAVNKGTNNDPLFTATIHYNSQTIGSGTWGNLSWTLDNYGKLTISGSGDMDWFNSGFTQAWRAYYDQIRSVQINNGVTSVGSLAFAYFPELTSVSIPSSVTSIYEGAFSDCDRLTSISIPSNVTHISDSAFSDCNSLINISVSSTNGRYCDLDGVLFNKDRTIIISYPGGRSGSYTIPYGVTIGDRAFTGCGLYSVIIPDGTTIIPGFSFSWSRNLTSVTIPQTVTNIGDYGFFSCNNLTDVYFGGTSSQWNAVSKGSYNDPLNRATIHYGSRIIDSGMWGSLNWSLNDDGLLTITGSGPMDNFSGDSNEAWRTYQWGHQIKAISIDSRITSIGDYAFINCSFSNITIPASLTSIGEHSFANNSQLTSLTIPEYVSDINASAFYGCNNLQSIFVDANNNYYCDQNGVVFNKGGTILVRYPTGLAGQYEIPYGVTTISLDAFADCDGLISVILPGSLRSIDNHAFFSCDGLIAIEIPSGVTSIGNQAFSSCDNLVSVKVPASATSVEYLFSDSDGLKTAGPIGSGCNYEYGWSVSIPKWAFDGCRAMTTITIPANITSIGEYAFFYCDSLTDVYFEGTQAQWDAITMGPGNEQLLNAGIHCAASTTYYTVTYYANGGTGTPSSQTKAENVSLTLSSVTPTKNYLIQYNAAGGSVSPASKSVSCTFRNWNTELNGSGNSYGPNDPYSENSDVTLYAQWSNPTAGTLATPTRSGYDFTGWFTSAAGGTRIDSSTTITGNMTVYAQWADPYNMGDESYSFENYPDSDAEGHCFGMSMTSAGYHLGLLDITRIGGNLNTPLFSFADSQRVRLPICYYQGIQGDYRDNSTIAGGSWYLNGYYDISSDWQAVINKVRDHSYDNTGLLQIGFRKNGEGGHAINFLRYERVNGQDRLYAYDNNYPTQETYFYQDSSGLVWQTPVQTFSGTIDCIALRDCRIYYSLVGSFDSTHVLYMPKDANIVQGYTYSYMEGATLGKEYVMYEIPSNQDQVIIIPNRDNADFIYMDREYSFGEITDKTYGVLKFVSMNEGAINEDNIFQVFEAESQFGKPDFILPSALTKIDESAFEGIAATTIYVPDSCTSIGAYAFRNSAIAQIRIPANCSIADTAFAGCAKVEIFGTHGSPAENYCIVHENCKFVVETQ